MPTTAKAARYGAKVRIPSGAMGSRIRTNPYVPIFSSTPASRTEPTVGRGGVGVRQPAVQRPHRRLDREPDPDRQNGDDLHGCGQAPAVVSGECHHVECAGLEPDEEEAEQHHDGAEQRVEDELPGGGPASGAAPAGDEEVHRDEDHLERQEEQQQIEDGEGREGAGLEHEDQRDECLGGRARGQLEVAVERAEEGQQRGQDEKGERDAVDAEVDADVECGDPADVGRGLHLRRVVVVEAERQDDRGERGSRR